MGLVCGGFSRCVFLADDVRVCIFGGGGFLVRDDRCGLLQASGGARAR